MIVCIGRKTYVTKYIDTIPKVKSYIKTREKNVNFLKYDIFIDGKKNMQTIPADTLRIEFIEKENKND